MIDYQNYVFSKKEWVLYIFQGAALASLLGWIFYRSAFMCLILCGGIVFFIKNKKSELMKKRKEMLNLQFKDAILGITAALTAGYSIENAVYEARKDLFMIYPDDAYIIQEFSQIIKKLEINQTLEELLREFADRSGVEDIVSFSDVFSTAKRSGGDLLAIIRMTTQSIADKIEVKRSISIMIAAKKLEQRIMNVIPIFMIIYIGLSSKGFLDVLYQTFLGRAVMTVCMAIYAASFYIGNKIVQIEV